MTERLDDIMNAAERRIRSSGYNGFSFREIATDVGIKSASVHYHFPTKADLAAAVARRYRERFEAGVADDEASGMPRISAWRDAFRRALSDDGLMCLCGILAVEGDNLPEPVIAEVRRFMELGIERLNNATGDEDAGPRIMARLEGAMLVARSMGDTRIFDRATEDML
ncbi:TetR/AcrR family transcriptional regulator [uncultured Tateyamaria sp.]|uniref:TetR/AcrR family transcriptional regulator n=1 Tax=uncultured Tateyamaria sp. TaxID=455651 RepID=UPI00261C4AD7|nr:TetR/AcrR family transcriptional regulator [uncultured Tateyamaria sp.]